MFRKIEDFLAGWEFESGKTLEELRALTDNSLAQRVTEGGRTLGFLAWHITTSLSEMATHAGLPVHVTGENDPVPTHSAEIAATYEKASAALVQAVVSTWTNEQLSDKITMYGQQWTKSGVLSAVIAHQCHHRGQMTILMRQAGLRVPGVYGPAKEEWAAMGMPAQP